MYGRTGFTRSSWLNERAHRQQCVAANGIGKISIHWGQEHECKQIAGSRHALPQQRRISMGFSTNNNNNDHKNETENRPQQQQQQQHKMFTRCTAHTKRYDNELSSFASAYINLYKKFRVRKRERFLFLTVHVQHDVPVDTVIACTTSLFATVSLSLSASAVFAAPPVGFVRSASVLDAHIRARTKTELLYARRRHSRSGHIQAQASLCCRRW